MKGRKGMKYDGLPVAKMMKESPKTGGKKTTTLVSGNPEVVKSAKKKSVGAVSGTAAKPRGDRRPR